MVSISKSLGGVANQIQGANRCHWLKPCIMRYLLFGHQAIEKITYFDSTWSSIVRNISSNGLFSNLRIDIGRLYTFSRNIRMTTLRTPSNANRLRQKPILWNNEVTVFLPIFSTKPVRKSENRFIHEPVYSGYAIHRFVLCTELIVSRDTRSGSYKLTDTQNIFHWKTLPSQHRDFSEIRIILYQCSYVLQL